jgi:hypothetical protein
MIVKDKQDESYASISDTLCLLIFSLCFVVLLFLLP